jgi:hypothetical protein
MIAKTLPLLLLCACASTPPAPTQPQPELVQLAQPYAAQLRAVGITRLAVAGGGAMVQLETLSGPVYVRYPQNVPAVDFVLEIDADGLYAYELNFDKTRDAAVLDALVPQVIRATASNNELVWIHSNPWH